MYLSRLVLNPNHRSTWRNLHNRYELHRTIMSAFPNENGNARTKHDILYRIESDTKKNTVPILVQSLIEPKWSLLGDRHDSMRTKIKHVNGYIDGMHDGMIYRFKLEANPTRTVHKNRIPIITDDYIGTWLQRKGTQHGFQPLSFSTTRSIITPVKKKGLRTYNITLNTVIFDGILKVVNEQLFRQCMIHGIGRGKAFGFGLLSIAVIS